MEQLTLDQWQVKFDSDFPRGINAEIDYGDSDSNPWYLFPRIVVLEMNELMPRIFAACLDVDKSFGMTVASYTVTQTDPLLVARVITDDGTNWIWSSGIGDDIAPALAEMRKQIVGSKEYLEAS